MTDLARVRARDPAAAELPEEPVGGGGLTMNAPFRRASRVADHRLRNLKGAAMQEPSDTPAARAAIAALAMLGSGLGRCHV